MNTTFEMDGIIYNVEILDIKIEGEFLFKYAQRTENGDLNSEAIGFFENASMTFKGGYDSDFVALYSALRKIGEDGTTNHDVKLLSPEGSFTQKMYPNKLGVAVVRTDPNNTKVFWGELPVKFVAISKKV